MDLEFYLRMLILPLVNEIVMELLVRMVLVNLHF